MKALLDKGAQTTQKNIPQLDDKTERQNWGKYPIIFKKVK
jgi:hypothetical protein